MPKFGQWRKDVKAHPTVVEIKDLPEPLRAAIQQKDPEINTQPCIQDLVVQDIEARKQVGIERYGTVLQPFNGRSALMDAYQESLDLAVYLRQLLYEEQHGT